MMEEDFPTSPSKRRRTMSPEEDQSTAQTAMNSTSPATSVPHPETATRPTPGPEGVKKVIEDGAAGSVGFLDVLMEQVEAESTPSGLPENTSEPPQRRAPLPEPVLAVCPPEPPLQEIDSEEQTLDQQKDDELAAGKVLDPQEHHAIIDSAQVVQSSVQELEQPQVNGIVEESETKAQNNFERGDQAAVTPGLTQEDATMEGVERKPTELGSAHDIAAPQDAAPEAREWETDSSPYESSDSDSSTSSDSDDSDEDEAEYSMLDPEEQARILMQDGGSDDEGPKGKEKGNSNVRTANERPEEVIPKPNIEVTNDMRIELLGPVEAVVESTVVVKANTSGEYQVLESGSLLCLKDKSVVGVVAETMGRVEQPMYTIRFTNDAAIEEAGLATRGNMVYYVVPHSTFVFTQPLKGLKGSDASNFHDEEVGDDEMEFSDDEKEAEHKRQLKLKRQGRLGRDDGGRGGRGGRGRGRGRGDFRESSLRHSSLASSSEPIPDDASNGALNYDDDPDDGYTPLRRPSQDQHHAKREHEEGYTPLRRQSQDQPSPMSPPFKKEYGGHNQNRGRGGFRGDRGGRGNYRGGRGQGSFDNYNRHNYQSNQQQQHQQMPPPPSFSNQSQPQPYFSQPQQTPQLTPQAPFAPFSPSPISPLPGQQFNFGQFPTFPPPPPPPPGMHQSYGQQHQQGQHPQQNGRAWGGWQQPNLNQAAAAQVQKHLEELMRAQQQNRGAQGYGNHYGQGYGQGRP